MHICPYDDDDGDDVKFAIEFGVFLGLVIIPLRTPLRTKKLTL